jgi:hypothetical protein
MTDVIQDGERRHHAVLVSMGGRPAYPLALVDRVIEEGFVHGAESDYRDLVAPFMCDDANFEYPNVFMIQVGEWEVLTAWRRLARGLTANERHMRIGTLNSLKLFMRSWDRDDRIEAYAHAVKSTILEPRGLGSLPFDPLLDMDRQDKLTTWIEYAAYNHFYVALCTDIHKLHVPGTSSHLMQKTTNRSANQLPWIYAQIPLIQEEMRQEAGEAARTAEEETAEKEAAEKEAAEKEAAEKEAAEKEAAEKEAAEKEAAEKEAAEKEAAEKEAANKEVAGKQAAGKQAAEKEKEKTEKEAAARETAEPAEEETTEPAAKERAGPAAKGVVEPAVKKAGPAAKKIDPPAETATPRRSQRISNNARRPRETQRRSRRYENALAPGLLSTSTKRQQQQQQQQQRRRRSAAAAAAANNRPRSPSS